MGILYKKQNEEEEIPLNNTSFPNFFLRYKNTTGAKINWGLHLLRATLKLIFLSVIFICSFALVFFEFNIY